MLLYYILHIKCVYYYIIFKGALCCFWEEILIRREVSSTPDLFMPKQTKQTPFFHDWINKVTLNDNTLSFCFTLFICGGPCHLVSNSVLGTLFSSDNSLFIQLSKIEIFLSLYHYLINIVNILKFGVWISSPKLHSAPLITNKFNKWFDLSVWFQLFKCEYFLLPIFHITVNVMFFDLRENMWFEDDTSSCSIMCVKRFTLFL